MSVFDGIISIVPGVKREIICPVCNKSFKRGKDLKSHSVIHDDDKPYVCSQCPEAFKHKTSLKRHTLIHSGERPFMCRICGKSFRQKGSLNEHSLTHTGVKPHTCDVCNMGFTTKSNYSRHLRKHLLSKPFTCNVCHKGFNVRSYLNRHYRKHEEIDQTITSLLEAKPKTSVKDDEEHVVEKLPPKKFVVKKMVTEVNDSELKKHMCKVCCKPFKKLSDLKIHLQSHVHKKIYVCDICKCSFTSIGAFCKHKLAHNQGNLTGEDFLKETETPSKNLVKLVSIITTGVNKEYFIKNALDKRYVCNICNKTFPKEYQFMHHSITHKYPGPYYCDICGESADFVSLPELHKHYAEHGEVACICYNCSEESGIDVTKVNYSKDDMSKCDVCHKCFPDNSLLRKHFPIHKSKRPVLIKLNG